MATTKVLKAGRITKTKDGYLYERKIMYTGSNWLHLRLPFTLDLDEILEALHWLPIQDRYDEPHPIYPGDNGLSDEHVKKAKALITAKLEEVDRAARAEGLDMGLTIAEKILTATPEELRKSITEGKKYLASLKGGDV